MSGTRCGLYLICPSILPSGFDAVLDQTLAAGGVAALRVAGAAQAAALRPIAHRHGVALILAGDAAGAARLGCDGAHVDEAAQVRAARHMLGDLQLGAWCGGSRDAAMQAGQDGADYVSFGPFSDAEGATDPDLLGWWAKLMELPVVAEGGVTLANAEALVRTGADFLAVEDAVWRHDDGPDAALRAFRALIAAHALDA